MTFTLFRPLGRLGLLTNRSVVQMTSITNSSKEATARDFGPPICIPTGIPAFSHLIRKATQLSSH